MSAAPQSRHVPTASDRLGREIGATLTLGWPIVLANVAIYAMTATDFIMLGKLSPHALAAGSLGFTLFQPVMLLGVGIVAALAPIAAAKIGAGGRADELTRATHQSLLTACLYSAAAFLLLSQTERILFAIGEPADLARDAGTYLHGYMWSLLPNLLFFSARAIFSAYERPRPTLVAGVVAVAFNAVANYALIFGELGMPGLGILGSGVATTLSQTLMFLILLGASFLEPRVRGLHAFALPWRPARREFVALWRLGFPIGAMILAEVGVFSAATLAMGLIGRATLEAHTVALQIASITFMVPLGIGQAATVRVGLAFGARDAAAIGRAGWSAFGIALAYAAVSAALMIGAPRLLIAPFIDVDAAENADAVGIAVALLRVAAFFQIFDTAQCALANMLRGLHDSKWPFVIAVLGYWAIGAPVGLALAFLTPLGGVGVWIGLGVGLAAVSILLMSRWLAWQRRGFAA